MSTMEQVEQNIASAAISRVGQLTTGELALAPKSARGDQFSRSNPMYEL